MRYCALWVMAALVGAQSAWAHHSGAMFDSQKTITLTGEVRVFQWTNPHCWIQLSVPGPQGTIEWSVELGSPSQLYNIGWRPKTVFAGEKIVVQIHPMKDGSNGGLFVSGTHDNGAPLSTAP